MLKVLFVVVVDAAAFVLEVAMFVVVDDEDTVEVAAKWPLIGLVLGRLLPELLVAESVVMLK